MAIRIQLRRDTAANWTSSNPVLRAGEFGIETDTLKFKIGNGSSTWTQIANYANVTDANLSSSLNDYILLADQGTPGGPAELDLDGDLLIPEDSIILWYDAEYTYTTTLTATEPTDDRVITFPDATTTVVGTDTVDTLTNKSISLGSNTVTTTLAQLNTAVSDADLVSLSGTENLTNKTLSFSSNTITGTLAEFNTALTDANFAPIDSPTFTGTPTLPTGTIATTQAAGDSSTAVATTAFVGTAVANLVDSSPELLNTLDEIAAAIGDDPNFATTITTSIGLKAPLESPTFTGTVSGITSTMVGLGSVDNTSDADKPVSTATQTALDLKVDESLFDAKGDLLVGSADNVPAKLTVGTNGYLLTANSEATNGVEWAAAPVSLPSQTGNDGYYLTTDGTNASWGALVVPITTGTATVSANTATTVDTTALSGFTSIEYMVSLKQDSKVRTSKVVLQTDGTSVDMTEFAITETGGTIAGVVVSAAVASTNGVLQVTATDAATTNVTVKFSKVAL